MHVIITGVHGLVGSVLRPHLVSRGHRATPLVRAEAQNGGQPSWCPEQNQIALDGAGAFDAVIHLAGENIAQRWSAKAKRRIRDSRVNGTRLLCDALARQTSPPKVLICASATGFYGNRGEEILDEQSPPGSGFLADVCRAWEAATEPATRRGIRVVNLRLGIVLSRRGGALKKMLPPFRLGLGGKIGSGRQFWSWIAMDDVVAVVDHALQTETLRGPVNVVSPQALRNVEFTKFLAAALHRPAVLSVPKFAVKLLMSEMGEEALLSSICVKPARLEQTGFQFKFPELKEALEQLLAH